MPAEHPQHPGAATAKPSPQPKAAPDPLELDRHADDGGPVPEILNGGRAE